MESNRSTGKENVSLLGTVPRFVPLLQDDRSLVTATKNLGLFASLHSSNSLTGKFPGNWWRVTKSQSVPVARIRGVREVLPYSYEVRIPDPHKIKRDQY